MKWAIVTLNRQSIKLAKLLKSKTDNQIDIYTLDKYLEEDTSPIINGIRKFNKVLFDDYKVIIYVMAMGIIVRDIAPYMKHKSLDPAVICLSVDGKYVIPVLSGHLGGANQLAIEISKYIDACPVITTASDILNKTAVDMIAKENDLVISSFNQAKDITAMIINNDKIDIISDIPIKNNKTIKEVTNEAKGAIVVSNKTNISMDIPYALLIPKNLVLGIGARRGTPYILIRELIDKILKENYLSIKAINKIASIDIKSDEVGILDLADKLKVPFITYSSDELNEVVDLFDTSEFVKSITGVGAVSMPSGYLASSKGKCLVNKIAFEGMTISIWEEKNDIYS